MYQAFVLNDADDAKRNVEENGWAFAFNSHLRLTGNVSQNHELIFYLAICLQQISKETAKRYVPKLRSQDWDDSEWLNYQGRVTAAAELWNNKFWLIPPDSFKELTWPAPPREWTHEPNVKCSLEVNFRANPGEAHKVINVVRLDDSYSYDPMRSTASGPATLGYAGLWDTQDGKILVQQIPDASGVLHPHNHLAIAHEIGHLLGQRHIGVLKKTVLCLRAMDKNAPPTIIAGPGAVNEGEDSFECYGGFDMPSIADNIMGCGMAFDPVNAQPWKDRIALHTGTDPEAWKVSMTYVPPAARKWERGHRK
jgi:hypothetical protein